MKLCRMFFRALLCGVLPLCLLCGGLTVSAYAGSAPQSKTEGTNLRVMSYNVLVDNDESLGGWSWGQPLGNRGDKASAAIDYYRPDVIGFQECNYKWHVSLKSNLKDYAFVNADVPEEQELEKADSLGKKDWMCTTMMYNKTTLKLVENELIGYSCNYWGCIQRMRYISMALFEIKATGERFVFISTHLDAEKDEKGQQMRLTQSDELAERINYYKDTYGYPVISTGDYNSKFEDAPITNVVNKAGMTSHSRNRGGIDYILYSAGIQAKQFVVVSDNDLAGASDHDPVFADLLVQKYKFPTTNNKTTTTATTTAATAGDGLLVTKGTTSTTAKATKNSTVAQNKTTTSTDAVEETAPEQSTTAAPESDPTQEDSDGAVGIIGGADGSAATGITLQLTAGMWAAIIGIVVVLAGAVVTTILILNKK